MTTPSSTTDAVITVDNDGGKVKETQLWKIVSHKKKKRHFKHHGSHGTALDKSGPTRDVPIGCDWIQSWLKPYGLTRSMPLCLVGV